jgi:branched-chain amino acid transport system ATP-binding protein
MLNVTDLHTYYGESHVLQGVSLTVEKSQCVALLGRNGAGKTTTLRTIVGLTPARHGDVTFKGEAITRMATHRIVRLGLSYVPEDRGIFASVTVEEHLAMARNACRHRKSRKNVGYVFDIFPRLGERRRSFGWQLSGGEQQMLAIGRALISGPDLLILDEPSEGLAPVIISKLEEILLGIKALGMPILIVEQNYHLATSLADYVYVMSQGTVKFAGETKSLIDDDTVRRTYLSV